jgi:hypothetical protein
MAVGIDEGCVILGIVQLHQISNSSLILSDRCTLALTGPEKCLFGPGKLTNYLRAPAQLTDVVNDNDESLQIQIRFFLSNNRYSID